MPNTAFLPTISQRLQTSPRTSVRMAEGSSTSIGSLDHMCLTSILSHLEPVDLARASCTQRRWNDLARDLACWERACSEEYCTTELRDATGNACNDWQSCYASLRGSYGRYGSLAVRACHAMAHIKGWAQQHLPQLLPTLRPGATEEQLDAAEQQLQMKLPLALRAVYRICDGQAIAWFPNFPAQHLFGPAAVPDHGRDSYLLGLFGRMSFYEYQATTRLLPLKLLVAITRRLQTVMDTSLVCFAMADTMDRIFMVDAFTGHVAVQAGQRTRPEEGMWPVMAAAPVSPHPSPTPPIAEFAALRYPPKQSHAEGARQLQDGFLRFLEAYAARLTAGGEACIHRVDNRSAGICLFGLSTLGSFPQLPVHSMNEAQDVLELRGGAPEELGEGFREATTSGIVVRASARLVPDKVEMVQGHMRRLLFAYSVRFSLRSHQEQAAAWQAQGKPPHSFRPLARVQLLSRHWKIWSAPFEQGQRALIQEVNGEGVIGDYPILEAGGEEHVYQSCTPSASDNAAMSGHFKFVTGTIEDGTGSEINAECPVFPLKVPDYVY